MQKTRDLENRIIAMEGQIRQLEGQQATGQSAAIQEAGVQIAAAAPTPNQATAGSNESATEAIALGGAGGSASKALNPDIGVIGDFIGVTGHNPVQTSPSLQMHESEVGLQAI